MVSSHQQTLTQNKLQRTEASLLKLKERLAALQPVRRKSDQEPKKRGGPALQGVTRVQPKQKVVAKKAVQAVPATEEQEFGSVTPRLDYRKMAPGQVMVKPGRRAPKA